MEQQLPSLEVLALEEFVNHVINLWKKLGSCTESRAYKNLKDLIHKNISHVFADAVTKKLLERTCRLHNYNICSRDFLQAVIHPKVTHLQLNVCDFYSLNNTKHANEDIAAFIWNDIINELTSLTSLYISDKTDTYVPSIIPSQIVAIDVQHCDKLLTAIADSCPALKELHVRDFKATPVSIQSLQRLQFLEQLNIVNPASRLRCYGIGTIEFQSFITQLSSCLKSFSCSGVGVRDINNLATPQLFPELSSLTIFKLRIDELMSGNFKSLKTLHFWGVELYCGRLLRAVGPYLTTISLHLCLIGNLTILAAQCPSLENLSLKHVRFFLGDNHGLPEFYSLKTVHMECCPFCVWCPLTKSPNLIQMTLCYYTTDKRFDCLEKCLKINQFPHLELFNAGNSLADEVLPRLLSVCPTIKVVKGVKRSSLIEDMKVIYPWVQFCC